uniref:Tail protein n=1 Tax=viral metagenome TaxID=1070528 RepID=A0A6M3J4M5_9ZZZZ
MRVGLGGDFQRLKRALDVRMSPVLSGITMAVIAEIENKLTPYPPSSEANRPGGPGSRWYERGYGSRWLTMRGQMRGRKTSQMLGRKWQKQRRGRIGAVLGSPVTYAPYVHHDERQARFHGQRGWVTDKKAVEYVVRSGKVDRIVRQAMTRSFGR